MSWADTDPSSPPPHRGPRGAAEWLHHDIEHHAPHVGATWSSADIARARDLSTRRAQLLRAWLLRQRSAPSPCPAEAPAPTPEPGRPRKHLVIGDSHNRADADPAHWVWLSRLVADQRPDVIVNIGDHYDNEALSRHNNPSQREGQRVLADVEAGNQALALFHSKLPDDYAPEMHWTMGNHDAYVRRIAADHPHLDGLLDEHEAFAFHRRGWTVHEPEMPALVDGVAYCHYFTGNSGRPIGGMYQGAAMLRAVPQYSVIAGHAHTLKVRPQGNRINGRHRFGIVPGCFFRHSADYAGQSNHEWWRGVMMLEHVDDGCFDPVPWSMDRLRYTYGG